MVMEFLCPKGHKIRCSQERAGKAAKCPKCGVKFFIPQLSEIATSDSGNWATASVEASGSPGSGLGRQDQIEFLCPRGHRLWASVELQGRPGQCPDCGSKFHIPTLEDYEQFESAVADPDALASPEESALNLDELEPLARDAGSKLHPAGRGETLPTHGNTAEPPGQMSPRPGLANLLAEWIEQGAEHVAVEIRTSDGEVCRPSRVLPGLCSAELLAFTLPGEDEKPRIVIVPYAAITRLEVRGLDELPEELTR